MRYRADWVSGRSTFIHTRSPGARLGTWDAGKVVFPRVTVTSKVGPARSKGAGAAAAMEIGKAASSTKKHRNIIVAPTHVVVLALVRVYRDARVRGGLQIGSEVLSFLHADCAYAYACLEFESQPAAHTSHQARFNLKEIRVSSNHIVHTSDAAFETDVLNSDLPVLVDFWAEWCGPCKMIAPVLEDIAGHYEGKVRIAKLNVDENATVGREVQYPKHSDPAVVQQGPGNRPKGRSGLTGASARISGRPLA